MLVIGKHQSISPIHGITSGTQCGCPGSSLEGRVGPGSERWKGGREDLPHKRVHCRVCPMGAARRDLAGHVGSITGTRA